MLTLLDVNVDLAIREQHVLEVSSFANVNLAIREC